jgi:hypothetical protein
MLVNLEMTPVALFETYLGANADDSHMTYDETTARYKRIRQISLLKCLKNTWIKA